MPIGISSSCFYPLQTEQAFLRLAELGIRHTEIFFNAASETEGELLQSVLQIQKSYEIKVHAVHPYCTFAEPYLFFSNYRRRFEDGIEIYRRLGDTCHALGCDLLILHGDREPFHVDEAEYIQRFCEMVTVLKQDGIRLSQENVVRFRSADLSILRALRDILHDDFSMTLDIKQAVRCKLDPIQLVQEFAPNIVHVHLSDHGAKGDCLLPGQGEFSFDRLFSLLDAESFSGDYVLEVYRSAFQTETELVDSYNSVRRLLEENTKI